MSEDNKQNIKVPIEDVIEIKHVKMPMKDKEDVYVQSSTTKCVFCGGINYPGDTRTDEAFWMCPDCKIQIPMTKSEMEFINKRRVYY